MEKSLAGKSSVDSPLNQGAAEAAASAPAAVSAARRPTAAVLLAGSGRWETDGSRATAASAEESIPPPSSRASASPNWLFSGTRFLSFFLFL